jgi:uncharacterized protein YegP (UPF0339 family)
MKFEIRRDKDGLYYFVFVSSNGRDICWSESYSTETNVVHAIEIIKQNARTAPVFRA